VFDRFTDVARHIIVWAQEEARLLRHNYIGTEHLLLGLTHDEHGVATEALESFGVSTLTVRASVEELIGVGGSEPSGHVPFTPRAKKVMELSLREALLLGHNYIGSEHLLLGLVREGEGVAAQVLMRHGADLESVRQRIVEILGTRDPESGTWPQRVPSRSGIAGIFEPALHEARRLGDEWVGAEHVVLAALESEDSLAGKVLRSFGLEKAAVEARIIEMRGEGSAPTPE
jgi:ATP-dependent Clp protease ATP-binding subunit ClpC